MDKWSNQQPVIVTQGTLQGPPITHQVHIFHLTKSIFHHYKKTMAIKRTAQLQLLNQFDVSAQPDREEKSGEHNTAPDSSAPGLTSVFSSLPFRVFYFYHSYFSYCFTITCMSFTLLIIWVMHSKQSSFKLQFLWMNFIWESWFFRGIKCWEKASPCWWILGCFSEWVLTEKKPAPVSTETSNAAVSSEASFLSSL